MTAKLAIDGGTPLRTRPFTAWPIFDEGDEHALLDTLHSGKWGRHHGHKVEEFEIAFAAYQDARYCIAVVNGSVALRLALMAAGVEEGAEVIVPAYTFIASASVILEANAIPIFVDVEPDTLNLDPSKIEAAITPRTQAILPVHFAGQACSMGPILEIARRHGLKVIEDAAQAHGSEYNGKKVGALADLGGFSFQSSKNLTCGEGGAILTNDDGFERLARSLHTCGRFPGGAWYDHSVAGGNYRMSEFHGALLLSQMTRLEEQTLLRNANGLYLNEKLSAIPGILPIARRPENTRCCQHLYMFRYQPEAFDGLPRQRFLEAINAEGIPCTGGYYRPLYRQPVFANLNFGPFTSYRRTRPDLSYRDLDLPASEQACREVVWLVQQTLLGSREDMDDIVHAVEKVYENRKGLAVSS